MSYRVLITLQFLAVAITATAFLLNAGAAYGQESGEELVRCPPYFRGIEPVGGETPRDVADRFVKGIQEGNLAQIMSSFDLRTLESIVLAMQFTEEARLATLEEEVLTRSYERFGEDARRELREQLGSARGEKTLREIYSWDSLGLTSQNGLSTARLDSEAALLPLLIKKIDERWYISAPDEAYVISVSMTRTLDRVERVLPAIRKLKIEVEQSETARTFAAKAEALLAEQPEPGAWAWAAIDERLGKSDAECPPFFRSLSPLGGATPRVAAERFLDAILARDRSLAIATMNMGRLASLSKAIVYTELEIIDFFELQIEARTRQRFGEQGVKLLQEHAGVFPSSHTRAEVDAIPSRIEVVIESGGSVGWFPHPLKESRAGNAAVRMQEKDGWWYIVPEASQLSAVSDEPVLDRLVLLAAGVFLHKLAQAEKALDESETLEGFKEKLEAALPSSRVENGRDAKEGREELEVLEEQELDE